MNSLFNSQGNRFPLPLHHQTLSRSLPLSSPSWIHGDGLLPFWLLNLINIWIQHDMRPMSNILLPFPTIHTYCSANLYLMFSKRQKPSRHTWVQENGFKSQLLWLLQKHHLSQVPILSFPPSLPSIPFSIALISTSQNTPFHWFLFAFVFPWESIVEFETNKPTNKKWFVFLELRLPSSHCWVFV